MTIFALLLLAASVRAQDALQEAAPVISDALQAALKAQHAADAAGPDAGALPAAYVQAAAPARDAVDADAGCVLRNANDDAGLSYCLDPEAKRAFTLSNRGSPRVNPQGGGLRRDYEFYSARGSRQELGVTVSEWGCPDAGGDDSDCTMMTELVFLPRKALPSLRLIPEKKVYEAVLPTGETVLFDAATKEIVGGVLAETGPMDARPDRHARTFAALSYSGNGVMIRSDQRGDSPRSAVVWKQKKTATATWRGKTCTLTPADVWSQNVQNEGGNGRYPTDAEFYAMLKRRCRWDLSEGSF